MGEEQLGGRHIGMRGEIGETPPVSSLRPVNVSDKSHNVKQTRGQMEGEIANLKPL
jgi:hypothetical protein